VWSNMHLQASRYARGSKPKTYELLIEGTEVSGTPLPLTSRTTTDPGLQTPTVIVQPWGDDGMHNSICDQRPLLKIVVCLAVIGTIACVGVSLLQRPSVPNKKAKEAIWVPKITEMTPLVIFPMSFEGPYGGECPAQWTCVGQARVCRDPPMTPFCTHPGLAKLEGAQYMTVGNDLELGNATSPIFYLPPQAERIDFRRSGGADEGSGFFVHLARNDEVICNVVGGMDTNEFFKQSCAVAGYAGEAVYIALRDLQSSPWGKVLVDDIRLIGPQGANILAVVMLSTTTTTTTRTMTDTTTTSTMSTTQTGTTKTCSTFTSTKTPTVTGTTVTQTKTISTTTTLTQTITRTTTTTVTHRFNWLIPPPCAEGEQHNSLIVYAGKDKQPYIDGAVMLGLALRQLVPQFCRLCLVVKTMSYANKQLLTDAGWNLLEVDDWHPTKQHFAHNYWWDVYNKINIFRVKTRHLMLYMDADMYVFSHDIKVVLERQLPPGTIAMVKDEQKNNYNTGLMLFWPDVEMFRKLRHDMIKHTGWGGLDQPLINREYQGRVVQLETRFNAHGSSAVCNNAVVAHYTGHFKPAFADVNNLGRVKLGYHRAPPYLQCPMLYKAYFCKMKAYSVQLSPALQAALSRVDAVDCPEVREYL